MLRVTDRYTDELFQCDEALVHKNELNRIVLDPERFREDSDEIMAKAGMGAIYTKPLDGRDLRQLSGDRREELMQLLYDPYND